MDSFPVNITRTSPLGAAGNTLATIFEDSTVTFNAKVHACPAVSCRSFAVSE
jgi:hypothetical protein